MKPFAPVTLLVSAQVAAAQTTGPNGKGPAMVTMKIHSKTGGASSSAQTMLYWLTLPDARLLAQLLLERATAAEQGEAGLPKP